MSGPPTAQAPWRSASMRATCWISPTRSRARKCASCCRTRAHPPLSKMRRTRARFTSSCHSGFDLTFALNMRAGTAERSRLAVTRLQLTNFRSYGAGALNVSGTSVVLAGPNGAGKTNVLDAISLLSPGRGLRGAKLAEHARKGPSLVGGSTSEETLWAVAATVARGGTEYEIGTGLTQASASRQVRLNGVAAQSSADLGDIVQLI